MKEVTIDITSIIENGDNFERRFFNWLNDHKIYWRTLINQTKIMILEKDYSTIKEYWSEVEINKLF